MPFNLGLGEVLIILVLALVVFGGRLPEVGRSLGQGLRSFKEGLRNPTLAEPEEDADDEEEDDTAGDGEPAEEEEEEDDDGEAEETVEREAEGTAGGNGTTPDRSP